MASALLDDDDDSEMPDESTALRHGAEGVLTKVPSEEVAALSLKTCEECHLEIQQLMSAAGIGYSKKDVSPDEDLVEFLVVLDAATSPGSPIGSPPETPLHYS